MTTSTLNDTLERELASIRGMIESERIQKLTKVEEFITAYIGTALDTQLRELK